MNIREFFQQLYAKNNAETCSEFKARVERDADDELRDYLRHHRNVIDIEYTEVEKDVLMLNDKGERV